MRNTTYPVYALFIASLITLPVHAASQPCPFVWEHTLAGGMTSADVKALQQFLNRDSDTMVAASGTGSPGEESEYFGTKTAAAVVKFQEKYANKILVPSGLARGTGVLGQRTRAQMNQMCAAVGMPATTQSTENASAASPALVITRIDQPLQSIAPSGAGGVPFTSFALTATGADIEIRNIAIALAGAASKEAFESVIVEDGEGEFATEEKGFNSHGVAALSAGFTIPAGSTHTFTVFGNMDETVDYDGQMPVLRVTAIDASHPLSGSLPLDGTAQRINSTLEIGGASAMLSSYDPGADRDLYINETGVRFSAIRVTADSREDLELAGMEWEQTGSVGAGDIANVMIVVDGVEYATENDGRVYASAFSPAIKIKKGMTIDAHIRGDLLAGAANRTVKFDIDASDGISLIGSQYGFGVGIAAGGSTATSGNSAFLTSDGTEDGDEMTPFFSGSLVRVLSGGIVSVTRN